MTSGRQPWPEERQQPQSEGIRVRRWGMRLLAFLAIAFVAVVLSSVQHHYTMVTALMVLVSLPGAVICTVAGLKAMYDVPPDQRARGRSQQ